MTCICTGCDLYDPPHRRKVRGDLHEVGHTLVFIGNVWDSGQPVWQFDVPPPDSAKDKAIILTAYASDYIERRGVFCIQRAGVSQALRDHVQAYQQDWANKLKDGWVVS